MVKVRVWNIGRITLRVTVGVIDGIYVVWCEKSIVKKVGIGIGNTSEQ